MLNHQIHSPTQDIQPTSPDPATHLPNINTPSELLPAEMALPSAKTSAPEAIVYFLENRSEIVPATIPVSALGTNMMATTMPRVRGRSTPN